MLYRIISLITELSTRQFFRVISIAGEKPIATGPVLIAATHPNQAVDPFIIGSVFPRAVFFIAKSTLFKNPILAAFFRKLHMIPVYRPSDNVDVSKNETSFQQVTTELQNGSAVCIFPEGTSREERQLLPLKSGVSRMALTSEEQSNWQLGLVIQPVSITYSSPRVFQSSVTVTFGVPIPVVNYREQYGGNPKETVKNLTADIAQALTAISVSIPQLELQKDIERVTSLFDDEPDLRSQMQRISEESHAIARTLPGETAALRAELSKLHDEGARLGYFGIGSETIVSEDISLLQLCIVLLGCVLHIVPYLVTKWAAHFLVKDPENLASIKIGVGLISYLAWYITLAFLFSSLFASTYTAILTLIIVIILGDYANRYTEAALIYLKELLSSLRFGNSTKPEAFKNRKEQFLQDRQALKIKLLALSETYKNGIN